MSLRPPAPGGKPLLPPESAVVRTVREWDEFLAKPKPDPSVLRKQQLAADCLYGFLIVVGLGGIVLAIWWSAVQR